MIAKYFKTERPLALAITLLAGLTLITMTNSCRQQKQARRAPDPDWTLDVNHARTPNVPYGQIIGKINGEDFDYKRAVFHAGDISFISVHDDQTFVIRGLGMNISGNSIEVDTNSIDPPKIEVSWRGKHGLTHTETFTKGYAMELKIDTAHGRAFTGQIYLCLPDDSNSYIVGNFLAALPWPEFLP